MNFGDIFKSSFINAFSGNEVSGGQTVVILLSTCLVALYLFGVYRVVTRKTFYSKNFNISLAALAVITAIVIMTVQSNIVLSLGMVGALSIVRFRTAIKDPMDLVFLFWAISVGIACGARMLDMVLELWVAQEEELAEQLSVLPKVSSAYHLCPMMEKWHFNLKKQLHFWAYSDKVY